jgi:predicted small lipoprotein YifL
MLKLFRQCFVVALLVTLTACGSTSGMKRSDAGKAEPVEAQKAAINADFAAFTRVNVMDFTVELASPPRDEAKRAVAVSQASAAGKRFADKIADGLSATGKFTEVVRNDSRPGDLIIKGEVTRYEEGNRAARLLVGFGAGSANFDATVRFVNSTTAEEISQITVDQNSWFLGGLVAATQDVDDFIDGAASKVAEETVRAKSGQSD